MADNRYKIRIQDKDTTEMFYNVIELDFENEDFLIILKISEIAMANGYNVLMGMPEVESRK